MTQVLKLLNYQNYLQPDDIVNLKNYKYKAGDYTWLDTQMNAFWVAAVELLPRVACPDAEPGAEPDHRLRAGGEPDSRVPLRVL